MTDAAALDRSAQRMRRLGRLLRFGCVGALSGLCYGVIVHVLVEWFALPSTLAAGVAYATMLPLNFLMQKFLVFQSRQNPKAEIGRYVTTHLLGFCLSMAVMALVTGKLGLSHWAGSLAVFVAVACFSFVMMELWVFAKGKPKGWSPATRRPGLPDGSEGADPPAS